MSDKIRHQNAEAWQQIEQGRRGLRVWLGVRNLDDDASHGLMLLSGPKGLRKLRKWHERCAKEIRKYEGEKVRGK